MNLQKKPPKQILDIFKEHGFEKPDCNYRAYPKIFQNSAGPSDEIGLDSATTFTAEAYEERNGNFTVITCHGHFTTYPGNLDQAMYSIAPEWKLLKGV